MRKLFVLVFGALFGGAGVWFSYNYHVVKSEKETLCVPKQRPALTDIYCDIRKWSIAEWKQHPDLASDLVKHGRSELVIDSTAKNLFDDFTRPFSTSPSTSRSSDRNADRSSSW